MYCQRCGYLLYNLSRSLCPECGAPFLVSRYRFEPGTVSFRCPHCDQAYFGNDERGLPSPRQFACVQCHQHVDLEQMRVVPETQDAIGGIGSFWDRREQIGLATAWWKTTKQVLFSPTTFYRVQEGRRHREALLYAVFSIYVGLIPALLFHWLLMAGFVGMMQSAGMPAVPWWAFALMYGCVALFSPLIIPVVVGGLWSATIQLALLVLAPNRDTLGQTLRTVLYSFGTYPVYAVPICGAYAGAIWQIVALVIGLREVHRMGTGRAVLAVLWPIAVIVPAYFALVAAIIAFA